MSETTLSVAQARIQLYPIIDQFEAGTLTHVNIKSRSGKGAVLVSAELYKALTEAKFHLDSVSK